MTTMNAWAITEGVLTSTTLTPGLDALQAIVGGYIEAAFTIPSPQGDQRAITGYVNDEGLLTNLPIQIMTVARNGTVAYLAGNMVIVGLDESTGETIGLTDGELEWVEQRCVKHQTVQGTPITVLYLGAS